jgi:hypothetical protein
MKVPADCLIEAHHHLDIYGAGQLWNQPLREIAEVLSLRSCERGGSL